MTAMKDKYLILGCGPAGLIAAHTLREAGVPRYEIEIVTDSKARSVIGGAQYLHEDILGTAPDFTIETVCIGDEYGYAEKVYGNECFPTSFKDIKEVQQAWSLRKVYENLSSRFASRIFVEKVDARILGELADSYKKVFTSIPAPTVCRGRGVHDFPSMSYSLVSRYPIDHWLDNVVIYNGRNDDPWYRYSSIEDHQWFEFSRDACPGEFRDQAVTGKKPMGTNCDCCETIDVVRIGRGGTWDRKVLLHHVVEQVTRAL